MCVLSDLATTLQTLLTTEAEQAARNTGCVRRVRKLCGATFVQTLGFAPKPGFSGGFSGNRPFCLKTGDDFYDLNESAQSS
jgi:hypothetical protein